MESTAERVKNKLFICYECRFYNFPQSDEDGSFICGCSNSNVSFQEIPRKKKCGHFKPRTERQLKYDRVHGWRD